MKDFTSTINPKNSRQCKACLLYLNQFPLTDNASNADVFWVGLSAVRLDDKNNRDIPLSPTTRSGKLIQDIELQVQGDVTFLKTNLVKCLPLNESKIRYPEINEMHRCFGNLKDEIDIHRPQIIFLLGRQVADFVLKKFDLRLDKVGQSFEYKSYHAHSIRFIPIHHPSYILIYKRKFISEYISSVSNIITSSQKSCSTVA